VFRYAYVSVLQYIDVCAVGLKSSDLKVF